MKPARARAARLFHSAIAGALVLALTASTQAAVGQGKPARLPSIKTVEIGPNREFRVNGKAFLPIGGWLQGPQNFPALKAVGINTVFGYYWNPTDQSGAGGTLDAAQYADLVWDADLYFISPYMPQHRSAMRDLTRSRNLLAWIHDDEPDLPAIVSDAQFTPGKGLKINPGAPLANMLDGDLRTEAVVDPMRGGEFSVRFAHPVSVLALGLRSPLNAEISHPRGITVLADGKPLIKVTMDNTDALQRFPLPAPASFSQLTVKVDTAYPAKQEWGFVTELQGYDAKGANVLLSPVRQEPQISPAKAQAAYQAIKAADPSRPVMMTTTSYFMPDFEGGRYSKAKINQIYPAYIKATDISGFDIYPIYGYNMPEHLDWVARGLRDLRALTGPRKPVYAWIEVAPGGNFGAQAKPVTGVEIRHEVYQAIIGGATAIGYFTHQFAPVFSEFGVPPENQRALLAINRQLERLAPVILGPDAARQPRMTIAGGLPSQLLAKQGPDALWIFAQNMDMGRKAGRATFTVEGLRAGTRIEVVDENRQIAASAGSFADDFAPLGVHIYKIAGAAG